MDLTPDQQRKTIEIFTALGWKDISHGEHYSNLIYGTPPREARKLLPSIFTSRDACASARAKLTEEQQRHYALHLCVIVLGEDRFPTGYNGIFLLLNAPASAHAEVLHRTLVPQQS